MILDLKKELAILISKFLFVKVKKGLCKNINIYGNLFINRRSDELRPEELFYSLLDLKDKTVLEVGANIGLFTAYLSKKIQKGRLIAVEPNPKNFFFLKKNISINHCANVEVCQAGLSDKNGNLNFVSKRYNTEKGTFKSDKQELIKNSRQPFIELDIPVYKADDVIRGLQCSQLDFVKIDTEGFEPNVIKGMLSCIRQFQPLIFFEIHGLNHEQQTRDLSNILIMLSELNYRILNLSEGLPEIGPEPAIPNISSRYFIACTNKHDLNGVFLAFKNSNLDT